MEKLRGTNMKITFKELTSGAAYQKHATEFCKALIFLSFITLAVCYFTLDNIGLLYAFIFFFVWSCFGVSILVAMPLYLLITLALVQMSSHTEYPSGKPNSTIGHFWKLISTVINFKVYGVSIYSTYYLVQYFN
jgi:hypothetical protein